MACMAISISLLQLTKVLNIFYSCKSTEMNIEEERSNKVCDIIQKNVTDKVFFLWMPQTHPWMLGFFEERPTFFQNDHCTARGSQHFD